MIMLTLQWRYRKELGVANRQLRTSTGPQNQKRKLKRERTLNSSSVVDNSYCTSGYFSTESVRMELQDIYYTNAEYIETVSGRLLKTDSLNSGCYWSVVKLFNRSLFAATAAFTPMFYCSRVRIMKLMSVDLVHTKYWFDFDNLCVLNFTTK